MMFRGRGGRGGGRGRAPPPHLMNSVPSMRLKPGRGMPPRGSPVSRRGGPPQPLLPPAAYDGPPRYSAPRGRPGPPGPPFAPERPLRAPLGPSGPPMSYGRPTPPGPMRPLMGGPRPAPYPSRGGYGGPPSRGRGGPSRGRGAPSRGRGAPSRGRGATRGAKAAAPAKPAQPKTPQQSKAPKAKKATKTEEERDAIVMKKPWVTPALRDEIQKKYELHAASRKSEDPKDFEAFKEQRNKVTSMLRAAKMEYIGLHEEQDVDKIMSEIAAKRAREIAEASAAAESKAEPKAAENGADTPAAQPTKVKVEPGVNGSDAEQPTGLAENGIKAEPTNENGVKAEPTSENGIKAEPTSENGIKAEPTAA